MMFYARSELLLLTLVGSRMLDTQERCAHDLMLTCSGLLHGQVQAPGLIVSGRSLIQHVVSSLTIGLSGMPADGGSCCRLLEDLHRILLSSFSFCHC